MLSNLGLGVGAGFQNWRLGRQLTLAGQLFGLRCDWGWGRAFVLQGFPDISWKGCNAEEMLQRHLSIVVKKIPGPFHKVKGKRKLR